MPERAVTWVMVIGGLLTLTTLFAAFAPEAATAMMFGEAVPGGAGAIIVRNWGILVGIVGALLVYGAFHRPSRQLALVVAIFSKTAFVVLILMQGGAYIAAAASLLAVDVVFIVLFAAILVLSRRA